MINQEITQNKILAVRDINRGIIAIVDSPETAAAFLMDGWIGCRSTVWSYETKTEIEIQNIFGVTGRKGISDEELYNFCVNMFKNVYSGIYDWDFDLCYLDYWISK